jgi:hypothetical protein
VVVDKRPPGSHSSKEGVVVLAQVGGFPMNGGDEWRWVTKGDGGADKTPWLAFERRWGSGFATKGGGGKKSPPSHSSEQSWWWTMNGRWWWVTKGGGFKRDPISCSSE